MQTKYTIFFGKLYFYTNSFNARTFAKGKPLGNNAFPHRNYFCIAFESRSFLNRGNWYPSILNWLYGKLVSSLVSSMQILSILDVEMIALKQIIFSFKEFILRSPIIGFLALVFLNLDRPFKSESKTNSFV